MSTDRLCKGLVHLKAPVKLLDFPSRKLLRGSAQIHRSNLNLTVYTHPLTIYFEILFLIICNLTAPCGMTLGQLQSSYGELWDNWYNICIRTGADQSEAVLPCVSANERAGYCHVTVMQGMQGQGHRAPGTLVVWRHQFIALLSPLMKHYQTDFKKGELKEENKTTWWRKYSVRWKESISECMW